MSSRVYLPPEIRPADRRAIELIEQLREDLRFRTAEPRRWFGNLRRIAFARAVQGSNSIEGYNASLDDVVAAVHDDAPLDADGEVRLALLGYRDAMTYVLQIAADDAAARVDPAMLKSLHFMMLRHDLSKNPGQWRPGPIYVRNDHTDEIVYEGPDPELVPDLVDAALEALNADGSHPLVRAAMAHLNLVMIHPFSDGNGRMARCLQSLVLAREQILAPAFSSIEEYLGRNTVDYYTVLADVGQGSWNPSRDARPWLRFCLTAHYRQARTHLRRAEEIAELWKQCRALAEQHSLQERSVGALLEVALGLRIRNASYRSILRTTLDEEVTLLTASRDLKQIVDAGFFAPVGDGRGRHYHATEQLRNEWERIRAARPPRAADDPYAADPGVGQQLALDTG